MLLALLEQPAVNWMGSASVNPMWLVIAVIVVHQWHLALDLKAANVRTQKTHKKTSFSFWTSDSFYIMKSDMFTGCECDSRGSVSELCDQVTGQCVCHSEVTGQRCDRCQTGFWGFPFCQLCDCNGLSEVCDGETGACLNCRGRTTGASCDRLNIQHVVKLG